MKGKWNLRIGILLFLLVFGIYVRFHRRSASYIKRYRLLNIPDSTHIVEFDIIKSGDTIRLNKKTNRWSVSFGGRKLPANANKIENLASRLAEAKYQIAGLNTKDLKEYGISDSASTILTIKTDRGETKTLIIGKRGPTYSSFYFVFPDKKKVYLLLGVAPYIVSTEAEAYRDKNVVNLKVDDIKSFTLISDRDTLRITRMGDSLKSDPPRDTATIKATLNRARVLTAFGFADELPDSITGIKSSNKKIVFITQQDDTIKITVGKKGKHALYVASSKRPGEVFKVYLNWFDEVLKKAGMLTSSRS